MTRVVSSVLTTPPMRVWSALATLLLVAGCSSSSTDEGSYPLWKVEGKNNTVWLLGSVHLLPERAHPFPKAFDEAFDDAEVIAFEIDMGELDPSMMLGVFATAILPDGQTLEDVLSSKTWSMLEPKLDGLIDQLMSLGDNGAGGEAGGFAEMMTPDMLRGVVKRMQPWMVGFLLQGAGEGLEEYRPELGVDLHYAERAKSEGKRTAGLETMEAQINALKGSAGDDPDVFLQAMLEAESDFSSNVDDIVDAWIAGDLAEIEAQVNGGLEAYPEAYDLLLTRRNENWIPHIERFLRSDENHLVIVGAGHLVGKTSVVALLREKGYDVDRQ